ncbi:unnamed protein product [Paramecium sonneborni]|uniref:Uncharacterized protein n=1 Tax=Paramecium sonneborni TaxID=65129 RepID=A0A8S1MCW5_9CILI|nr:unnamed protein product [Paramecium sonneborni]
MPPKTKKNELNPNRLKEEANKAFLNSEYDLALALYTKAIQIEENPIYYNNRSQAYFYMDDLELALQDCNRAVLLNPNYIKAIINKAQILYEMGYIQDAIQCLQQTENQSSEIEKHLNYYKSIALQSSIDSGELERQKRLLEWLKSGQAVFPKIKIECYGEDYRGVNARKSISQKEIILFVPRSHMITLEMAKETPVAKKIIQNRLDLLSPKHSFLSTFLLQEKSKQDSFWKPYLDVLPKLYSSFPIFFNDNDLEWLKGSPFLKQVKQKITDLKKDYCDICQIAPEFLQHSFDEFCWARMTASSRIFGINIKGVKTDAFVPLADMLNHKRPKLTSWCYSDEKQGFIIETDENIEKGQMIFDSYGSKCNSRFLLNYGFVVEDNNANEVNVYVEPDGSIPFIQLKEAFIKETLTLPKSFRLVIDPDDVMILDFMSFIRLIVIKDENELINLLGKSSYFKPTKISFVGIQNELAMWNHIENICIHALNQYPTTLEQDNEILKICELTTNQKNCLILRMGEKKILNFYLQFSQQMHKLFSNFDFVELIKFQQTQENYHYFSYLNKITNDLKIQNRKLLL